jgi:TolA-binding protein
MLKPRKRLAKTKLKEDRFVIFTAQAEAWFEQHRKQALYGILALVVLLAAGIAFKLSKSSAEENASFQELMARDAFARSDLDSTLVRANAILDDYSGTNAAAVALMLKGRVYETRAQYDDAVKAYQDLVKDYGNREYLAFGAYYALATISIGKGDYEKAGDLYSQAANKYPSHFNASVALLEAGKAFEKIHNYPQAKAAYKKAISDYPKSRASDTARDNLAKLEFMP